MKKFLLSLAVLLLTACSVLSVAATPATPVKHPVIKTTGMPQHASIAPTTATQQCQQDPLSMTVPTGAIISPQQTIGSMMNVLTVPKQDATPQTTTNITSDADNDQAGITPWQQPSPQKEKKAEATTPIQKE